MGKQPDAAFREPASAACDLLLTGAQIEAILASAAERCSVDFRNYRGLNLQRGITERIRATSCADAASYRRYLEDRPDEAARLVESLVVPVTAFFRDADVFQALGDQVLPMLMAQVSQHRPLRVWNIGVSTGEEAWSISILLVLASERVGGISFEIIGSDIDECSLAAARAGRYSAQSLSCVPAALRTRFFRRDAEKESVTEELRTHVRFSLHDFMGPRLAPPEAIVASFELVLIRNVLIYFDQRLQEKAFDRLLSVVEPGGVLVLGPVERVPAQVANRFRPLPGINPSFRIFQRTEIR